jgi:hypothetical protein
MSLTPFRTPHDLVAADAAASPPVAGGLGHVWIVPFLLLLLLLRDGATRGGGISW